MNHVKHRTTSDVRALAFYLVLNSFCCCCCWPLCTASTWWASPVTASRLAQDHRRALPHPALHRPSGSKLGPSCSHGASTSPLSHLPSLFSVLESSYGGGICLFAALWPHLCLRDFCVDLIIHCLKSSGTMTCFVLLSFIEDVKILQMWKFYNIGALLFFDQKKKNPFSVYRMTGLSKVLHTFDIVFHTLNQPLSFLLLDTSLSPAGAFRQGPSVCVHACVSYPSFFPSVK